MKKTAKQALLFGAFALFLSTVPAHALTEETMVVEDLPGGVQEEVVTKQGFFANLTERARNFRLKNAMKELDRSWKPFIKCVAKGGEDCSKQARAVRTIILTVLALAGIAVVGGLGKWAKDKFGQRGDKLPDDLDAALKFEKESGFTDDEEEEVGEDPTFYVPTQYKGLLE